MGTRSPARRLTGSVLTTSIARSLAWILATVFGLSAGGFVLHFPGSYGEPAWSLGAGLFGLIIGFANGAVLGALQWLATGAGRRIGARLILAMGLGVGITHGLHDGSATTLSYPLLALVCGVAVAGVVAALVGERGRSAIAVGGLAWAGGLVLASYVGGWLGLPFEETPVGWSTDHAVDGIVVGLVWGAATAVGGLPDRLTELGRGIRPPGGGSAADAPG